MTTIKNTEEIIVAVENGELKLVSDDALFHHIEYINGCDSIYIGHFVEGYEFVEVYFAEHEEVEELRQLIYEGEADESELEEMVCNEYSDRFNYDDIVAYRIDSNEIQWI